MLVPWGGRRERPYPWIWARLRTVPGGEQRGPAAQTVFRQTLLGGLSETTSETHIEFAQPRFHDPARLADRFRDLILAVTESGKHVVARFEQRLQALHFGVHGESDAAYAAPETVRARASAPERQRVVALRGAAGFARRDQMARLIDAFPEMSRHGSGATGAGLIAATLRVRVPGPRLRA